MTKKLLILVSALNLPAAICSTMLGEDHKPVHRLSVGAVVMTGGVLLAKSAHAFSPAVGVLLDIVGYSIHALGVTPYIEVIAAYVERKRAKFSPAVVDSGIIVLLSEPKELA